MHNPFIKKKVGIIMQSEAGMSEPAQSEEETPEEPVTTEEVTETTYHVDYSTSYSNMAATLELEAENSSLRTQVGRLQRMLKRQEEEYFDMQKEIATLSASFKRKLQDKDEHIFELQEDHEQRLVEMQGQMDQRQDQIRALQETITELRGDLEQQLAKKTQLEKDLAKMAEENEAWRVHYLYVRSSLEQSHLEIETAHARQAELQKEIDRLNLEIEKMEELLGDKELLEAEKTDVATRLLQRKAEIEQLQRKKAELEEEVASRDKDIQDLEEELAEAIARPGKLVDENAKLREITAEAVDRYTKLRIRFESEILAQEALKMAVEKELQATGEALAAVAEGNIQNAMRWDSYIQNKDRNVKRMAELAKQLKRVKEKSKETEDALLLNLREHYQVSDKALPKTKQ